MPDGPVAITVSDPADTSPASVGPAFTADDCDELRIALVMNGGVSLAVWIGGVTVEYARLMAAGRRLRAPAATDTLSDLDAAYDSILKFAKLLPRIDVIAGTSAGGVNAAYLGAAIAFTGTAAELGVAMAGLRSVWIDDGAIDDLLRDPGESAPVSLLDGNGYYYRSILAAFGKINGAQPSRDAIDLTLTTTLMTGEPQHLADDYGSSVPDVCYRARFRFRQGDPAGSHDDFADRAGAVRKLALAARATSSFPGAFEPVFCPIQGTGGGQAADAIPPSGFPWMNGVAYTAEGAALPRSCYVIDGGVLDNKPLDVAIAAITAQPATRRARRVLAYIVPDPGSPDEEPDAADAAAPPSVLDVLAGSAVAIPMAQSISNQIRALRLHNSEVHARRLDRSAIAGHLDCKSLTCLSRTLFQAYRTRRFSRIQDVAVAAINTRLSATKGVQPMVANSRRARFFEQIGMLTPDDITVIPTIPPLDVHAAGERSSGSQWRWGHRAVVQIGWLAYDLLVRYERCCHPAPEITAPLWRDLSEQQGMADQLFKKAESRWTDEKLAAKMGRATQTTGPGDARSGPSAFGEHIMAMVNAPASGIGMPGEIALKLAQIVAAIARLVRPVPDGAPDDQEFRRLLGTLTACPVPGTGGVQADAVLAAMLAWHVIEDTLGGGNMLAEEEIAFIQVSANDDELVATARKAPVRMASDKLCSDQLAAFAGFYKTSWRAKDWAWGRRDATGRILRVLLDPKLLRQAGATAAQVCAAAREIAKSAGAAEEDLDTKCRIIADELRYLDVPGTIAPEQLHETIRFLADAIETLILVEELPEIAACIAGDQAAHTKIPDRVAQLATAIQHTKDIAELTGLAWSLLPGQRKVDTGLLAEPWRGELATDPAIYTGTRALAVAMGVVATSTETLRNVPAVFAPLRLFTRLLYAYASANRNRSRLIANLCFGVLAVSFTIIVSQLAAGADYNSLVTAIAYPAFAASYLAIWAMPRRGAAWLVVIALPLTVIVGGLWGLHHRYPNVRLQDTETKVAIAEVGIALLLSTRLWHLTKRGTGRCRYRRGP